MAVPGVIKLSYLVEVLVARGFKGDFIFRRIPSPGDAALSIGATHAQVPRLRVALAAVSGYIVVVMFVTSAVIIDRRRISDLIGVVDAGGATSVVAGVAQDSGIYVAVALVECGMFAVERLVTFTVATFLIYVSSVLNAFVAGERIVRAFNAQSPGRR